MAKRAYHSEKRREQSERTKSAIVQAMVEAMANGEDDVSVAELAELSGVARRTVYHHFPDRASRIAAIDEWVEGQVDTSGLLPEGFDDIPGYVERLVDYILDNEVVIRAQMAPGLSKSVRSHRKRAHAQSLRRALRERIQSKATIDRLVATLITTVRAEAVFDLRDLYGQSRQKIRRSLRRMAELLLEDATPG